ncbi:MAG: acetyl-CoA carboxylase carboxyltransferase subunit alpha [Chloroflexota bacterium]|nr:acetyl-CoA carboxylase carboxyltransferase subunit alpha [Chloroflexota bacterium]
MTLTAADDVKAAVWRRVQLARHPQRPRTLDLVARIFDEFTELHGDRAFGDDAAIVGGPAMLDGHPVMVIGHQKGSDTDSNIARNFGMPHPEGFRKAQRLMRLAEKLGLPVVTFIDTPGAAPDAAGEERGQAEAIAASIKLLTGLRVPVVAVIVGEGGSGGALAIGVADQVLSLENAVYSVISPEGCAAILWRSAEFAADAAVAMRMTAAEQAEIGTVDRVVDEPGDGAHDDPTATASRVRAALLEALSRLTAYDEESLLLTRYARLRSIGIYDDVGRGDRTAPRDDRAFARRLGRLLRLPGSRRRPRWSDVWPAGDLDNGADDDEPSPAER